MEPCTGAHCLIWAGKLKLYKVLTREEAGEIAYWNHLVLLFFFNFPVEMLSRQKEKNKCLDLYKNDEKKHCKMAAR